MNRLLAWAVFLFLACNTPENNKAELGQLLRFAFIGLLIEHYAEKIIATLKERE